MPPGKRRKHRKADARHREPHEDGQVKPRNPLVPVVRRLGHKTHEAEKAYKRRPKHKKRGWE